MYQKVFCLLLICIVASAIALKTSQPEHCVRVFDGVAIGKDSSVQTSLNSIATHWIEPKQGPSNLRFEWAVISEDLASSASKGCSYEAGIHFPDVMGWKDNGIHTTAMTKDIKLENGKTYFVIVRATTSQGLQIYSTSNGIRVDTAHQERISQSHIRSPRQETQKIKRNAAFPLGSCPITAERCKANEKSSVGDFLTQTYGPAEYAATSQAIRAFREIPEELLVVDSSPSSSSSGATLPVGAVIGIALAVAALCCFLVLAAAAAAAVLGSRDSTSDKYSMNTNRQDNIQEF